MENEEMRENEFEEMNIDNDINSDSVKNEDSDAKKNGSFGWAKASKLGDMAKAVASSVADASGGIAKGAKTKTKEVAAKSKDAALKSKDAIASAIDQNGDGTIDVEDIIILGLKTPGVRIRRDEFLQKELFKLYPEEVINKAIAENPMKAGIDAKDIDKIADEVIKFERNCVSGISAALGMPGGAALAATIPADIAQYYGYMLRAAQKLMYLYGFPEIDLKGEGQALDTETLNLLTLCLGVMFGAAGANNAIKSLAKALGTGVEKQLVKRALTKGTIYPIVKSVSKWFGVHMTKEVFAGFFKKAIPVAGGVIGGGLTYLTFKPCCDRLKTSLQNTMLSNKDYGAKDDEGTIDITADITVDADELTEV